MTNNNTTTTSSHYESHSAESYEGAYFYEPGAYMRHLVALTSSRLQLRQQQELQKQQKQQQQQQHRIGTTTDDANDETDTTTTTIASPSSPIRSINSHRRRVLLDIGGGTGNFARMLLEDGTDNDDELEVIVVDPFLDPSIEQSKTDDTTTNNNETESDRDCVGGGDSNNVRSRVSYIKASAEAFLVPPSRSPQLSSSSSSSSSDTTVGDWRTNYHQVLLKEVVHHLDAKDRVGIFRGMRQGMVDIDINDNNIINNNVIIDPSPNNDDVNNNNNNNDTVQPPGPLPVPTVIPSILIITRPDIDIDYPLWDEARMVWKNQQPSIGLLSSELKEAGYKHIEYTIEKYPCSISIHRWQGMVKNRFWSTFSYFTDDELDVACTFIADQYKDRMDDEGNIHFEDRLVFLSACN